MILAVRITDAEKHQQLLILGLVIVGLLVVALLVTLVNRSAARKFWKSSGGSRTRGENVVAGIIVTSMLAAVVCVVFWFVLLASPSGPPQEGDPCDQSNPPPGYDCVP
jgi:multisubunit Na+/H+ antiporter MnhB subunit